MSVDLRCSVDLSIARISTFKPESKVYRARSGSSSLKTTIPRWIVDSLDLDEGSSLEWASIYREDKPNLVLLSKKRGD